MISSDIGKEESGIYSKLYNEYEDFGISFLVSILRGYFTNNLDI